MRYFKVYEHGMWRVHAFELDAAADPFIPNDAIPISEDEAKELSQQLISEELQTLHREGVKALGGRGQTRYPTKDVKEAIGHICVNSSHLEVTLRTIIWHLAGVSAEVGMTLTGGRLSIQELLATLEALLELQVPSLLPDAKLIITKISELNKKRGQYVHGIWSPDPTGIPTVGKPFLTRSHAKGVSQKVALDELYDVAEGYMHLEAELLQKILQQLPPFNRIGPS